MNGIEQTLIGGVEGGTAILLPALGELISERAGVVNLGIEGCMLTGALVSFMAAVHSGNDWVGVVAGFVAGAVAASLHGWLVLFRGADQLASGLLLWFLALGVTSTFGTDYISQIVAPMGKVSIPGLADIPWVGPILFDHSPLVYVGYGLVAAIALGLVRTRLGLLVRASGERPEVVAAAGGNPRLIRLGAVMAGGGLAGVGGAYLSVAYVGNWVNDMTSGYGFVAVAVVLFAAWRPLGVLGGAYLFGVVLAASSVLQAHGIAINQYLLDALPYAVTLIALAALARRGRSSGPEELNRALTGVR